MNKTIINIIINIIINLMSHPLSIIIWPGNVSLSEFEKQWPGVKSHQITVKTVKTDRSQIKSSKSTDQVQDFKDPDQMTQI